MQLKKIPTGRKEGFTLIELSVVLVIIGLIIGGILTGQDLINNAAVRAQIAQIERYNAAVHAFENKYNFLPGDVPTTYATEFGFKNFPGSSQHGDGNGIIASWQQSILGDVFQCSENMLFWADLTTAGLIDGNYVASYSYNLPCSSGITTTSTPPLGAWLPTAKIGGNNYVYVWNGGYNVEYTATTASTLSNNDDDINYFGVSAITSIDFSINAPLGTTMTVNQAYGIDKKVDDGLPQSGNVMALYLNVYACYCTNGESVAWAAGGNNMGAANTTTTCTPTTVATNYQTYNCYDNAIPGSAVGAGGQAGVTQTYSTAKNGPRQNCALSFKFQ